MKILLLSFVASLTLLSGLSAKAECSRVLLTSTFLLHGSERIRDFPATKFSSDPAVPADIGVRYTVVDNTNMVTDPFGVQHQAGNYSRVEIFQNGQMVLSSPLVPENETDFMAMTEFTKNALTQLGCR